MKLTHKLVAVLKVLLSLVWIGVAILGLVGGLKGIAWLEAQADQALLVVEGNIGLVKSLMLEITHVLDEVDQSLGTVETGMIDGGLVLLESRPMIEKTSKLVVEDVPQAMDDIQDTMPAMIEAARAIEQSLALLSRFKFVIPIPLGTDLEFNLGLDYEPAVSLEDSLTNLNSSLQDVPAQMRIMEGDFVSANISMEVMSENLLNVAHNLDKAREQLGDINPELETIASSLEEIQVSLGTARDQLPLGLKTVRTALWVIFILLLLTQIPPLYSGSLVIASPTTREVVETTAAETTDEEG